MNSSRSYRAVAIGATALLGSALLVGVAGPAGPAAALDFCSPTVYSGFADTSTLALNGDAAIVSTADGTVLRVSPAANYKRGSAYSTDTVDLANDGSFSSAFSFRFTGQLGGGADGLVFTLQKSSTALGAVGGGIGYQNSGNPSLGVEFDNWYNGAAYGDVYANHAAINLNGSLATPVAFKHLPYPLTLDAAVRIYAWVDYNGVTNQLEVRVFAGPTRPADPFMTATVDLEGLGTAYMGFTSATGDAAANHDVIDWSFSDAEYQAGAFLPPINNDGSSVFKLGSTIPVKIAISCGGVPVETLTPTVQLEKASDVIPGAAVNEPVIVEVPTNGKVMDWVADDGFYKYNLSTKNSEFNGGLPLEPGIYRLSVVDPSLAAPASVMISLR